MFISCASFELILMWQVTMKFELLSFFLYKKSVIRYRVVFLCLHAKRAEQKLRDQRNKKMKVCEY